MPRPLVIFHPEQCTMKITMKIITTSSITEKSNVSAYTPTEKQNGCRRRVCSYPIF